MVWPLLKADEDFYTPALPQDQVAASHSGEQVGFFFKRIWKISLTCEKTSNGDFI